MEILRLCVCVLWLFRNYFQFKTKKFSFCFFFRKTHKKRLKKKLDTQQYQIDKCKGNFCECKKGRGTGSMLREMGRRSIKKIIEDKLFWPLLCFFLSLCAKCSHFLHTQHALIFIHSLTDTHTHT